MNREWFGPKEIGVGIRSWQGWLTTGVFVAGLFGLAPLVPDDYGLYKVAGIVLWILIFLDIVALTYERK